MKLPHKYIILLAYLASLLFSFELVAQKKIKYKNLYPLLQSKDFENATADLTIFLAENDDEANAYYYLGEIISLKLDTTRIFPQTTIYDSLVDAAVDAYKKSISLIDEKEVRKNDEFYMAYNRRDLRTGKFGIKVSDVHLDYENKISALEEKKRTVNEIHTLKDESASAYETLAKRIKKIGDTYTDKESFLLRLQEEDLNIFDEVFSLYDAFGNSIRAYREKLKELNHPLYQIELFTKKVDNWDAMYLPTIDLSAQQVVFQDYSEYFKLIKESYVSEVIPLKKVILESNANLDKAIVINKEVVDSSGTIQVNLPNSMLIGIDKFVSSNLISSLFTYKLIKSELSTLNNPSLNPILSDTLNFYLRAGYIASILKKQEYLYAQLKEIESLRDEKSENDISFYLNQYNPSFNEWLTFEKTINEKLIQTISIQNDSLQEKIKYILYKSDTLYMPAYSANHPLNSIQHVLKSDSSIIFSGVYGKNTFVANASFDMKLNNLAKIDSTYKVSKMLPLQNEYILNAVANDSLSFKNKLVFFNGKADPIWEFKYDTVDQMHAAKMEAGILFIYNKEEEIFLTLNKEGKQIGE